MKLAKFSILLALTAFSFAGAANAGTYALIVNSANPASGDAMKAEVKNLFLKQKTSWPSGDEAEPTARAAGSPEHAALLKSVLGMNQAALDGHWASEKSKSGTSAPKEVSSDSILFRQIGKKKGAFGYVPQSAVTPPPEGVKVLFTFSD
ncbi:MAG: hypothetical protein SFW64_02625 [Alphaproteobacteria bacterium]|nr:hypothetical protein [Alphaproteobacteria bacterium]